MITLLKSKIHRATVTFTNLEYEGSCSIDEDLMFAADIQEFEQIHIFNVSTGDRFITYAIPSKSPGAIELNGPGARLGQPGDKIIICTYAIVTPETLHKPVILLVNDNNKIT